MEQRIVTISAQELMVDVGAKVQKEIDRLKTEGWYLHQTDTTFNGASYSSLLTFNKD